MWLFKQNYLNEVQPFFFLFLLRNPSHIQAATIYIYDPDGR